MNLKRIWLLIQHEVLHGVKDTAVVMAVVMPILLALFVKLAFGDILSDRAKLGLYDAGSSQVAALLEANQSLSVKTYPSEAALRQATASGSVDMGLVLPAGFDAGIRDGSISLQAYVWGESLAKSRALIPAALADAVHQAAGDRVPVSVETVPLGAGGTSWTERLLPVAVLIAIFFGGLMLPASSLIHEKQRRTLTALYVTPATLGDIFWAKGAVGAALALVMGVVTLGLTQGFGGQTLPLLLVLGLGAVMAAEMGLLAGALIQDMNTLYAFWKFGGLLLLGPVAIFLFPAVPAWVGYFFPTYYVIKPVLDMSLGGQGLGAVALNVGILAVLVVLGALVTGRVVHRLSTQALRLG